MESTFLLFFFRKTRLLPSLWKSRVLNYSKVDPRYLVISGVEYGSWKKKKTKSTYDLYESLMDMYLFKMSNASRYYNVYNLGESLNE